MEAIHLVDVSGDDIDNDRSAYRNIPGIGSVRLGYVTLGRNGRWFAVPVSREAHADPLDGRDTIDGHGALTPEGVARVQWATLEEHLDAMTPVARQILGDAGQHDGASIYAVKIIDGLPDSWHRTGPQSDPRYGQLDGRTIRDWRYLAVSPESTAAAIAHQLVRPDTGSATAKRKRTTM